jgi:hypothetical protein
MRPRRDMPGIWQDRFAPRSRWGAAVVTPPFELASYAAIAREEARRGFWRTTRSTL